MTIKFSWDCIKIVSEVCLKYTERSMIMTHEEISQRTKNELAESLKKLMAKKPLDKITVTELVESCNVNRKTFYYHFQDIRDLLKWILEEEAVNVVRQFDMLSDLESVIIFVMDYVESNSLILGCAYNSLGRDGLKSFLSKDFFSIVDATISACERELGIFLEKDYKSLLCTFM